MIEWNDQGNYYQPDALRFSAICSIFCEGEMHNKQQKQQPPTLMISHKT